MLRKVIDRAPRPPPLIPLFHPLVTTNSLQRATTRAILLAMPDVTTPIALDEVDKRLIEVLQQDGRRPYTQLAQEVGLSEAAVRQRVRRLVETGVTQIVAVTNPLMLGFRRMAMVGIRVEGDVRTAADAIAALPQIDYLIIVAGSFDLLVEIVCEDDDDLLELLNDKIRGVPGVLSTDTFTYLKISKETYTWGTR
jgi:Lrp/AsnC family transcriptional regulator for asnA, asnC and gidA